LLTFTYFSPSFPFFFCSFQYQNLLKRTEKEQKKNEKEGEKKVKVNKIKNI